LIFAIFISFSSFHLTFTPHFISIRRSHFADISISFLIFFTPDFTITAFFIIRSHSRLTLSLFSFSKNFLFHFQIKTLPEMII